MFILEGMEPLVQRLEFFHVIGMTGYVRLGPTVVGWGTNACCVHTGVAVVCVHVGADVV